VRAHSFPQVKAVRHSVCLSESSILIHGGRSGRLVLPRGHGGKERVRERERNRESGVKGLPEVPTSLFARAEVRRW
jgi:hypothetical protein